MNRKTAPKSPKTIRAPRRAARSASTELSLSDLEVPVRPLLTKDEEWRAGGRIQSSLARLARLLPRHPRGYRRYIGRMDGVIAGSGSLFSWIQLRERIAKDNAKATRALERATKHAEAGDEAKAKRSLEQGIAILLTYPLDPETLFQWSREAVADSLPEDALSQLPRQRQVDRILRRLVRIIERERDRLVLPNFRLVLKDVFRYHPMGMRRSDLFQEGVLGLHKAVLRYDPSRATRFSTYATYWIRQSIRKALIDKSRMIRVPQAVQEQMRKPEPKLDPQERARVRRIMSETMLFSSGDGDDSSDRSSFAVAERRGASTDEELHTRVVPRAVAKALESLDTRSREVVQRRFGLIGDPPQTLEEIGKLMSLSRERIRQIEDAALRRMQRLSDLREVYEDLREVQPLVSGASRN